MLLELWYHLSIFELLTKLNLFCNNLPLTFFEIVMNYPFLLNICMEINKDDEFMELNDDLVKNDKFKQYENNQFNEDLEFDHDLQQINNIRDEIIKNQLKKSRNSPKCYKLIIHEQIENKKSFYYNNSPGHI